MTEGVSPSGLAVPARHPLPHDGPQPSLSDQTLPSTESGGGGRGGGWQLGACGPPALGSENLHPCVSSPSCQLSDLEYVIGLELTTLLEHGNNIRR